MNKDWIYLDYNATTPVDQQVLEEMLPFFSESYGNASSVYHKWGRKAAEAVETARKRVADAIHAHSKEIIFTSGATEAINQALKGIFTHYKGIGKHIITCQTEHPAVLDTCAYLQSQGAEITCLPVDRSGNISLEALERTIRKDTMLVALMAANNETGVVHPIKAIGQICQRHQVLFFCDATQAIGKMSIDVQDQQIDLLCLSAHKCYGPKGIGALYIKRRTKPIQIGSLLNGGKQENRLRAGTLNVPAIVGFGSAIQFAVKEMPSKIVTNSRLRDLLEQELSTLAETTVNGQVAERLPNTSNICFRYVKAAELMGRLPHIALSSGSACASGSLDPSPVLLAMGLSHEDAHASIRISLGNPTTEKEVQATISYIKEAVHQLREASPIWQMHQAGIL